MVILEDTRNKAYKAKNGRMVDKHRNIHDYCARNGIEIIRSKMLVGDYTLPANQSVCIDTKTNMVEVSQNIYQDHKRFRAELDLAQRLGIKLIVLIEDDSVTSWQALLKWKNPQPNAGPLTPDGERCYKVMKALENKYGCEFRFCTKDQTGATIIELLKGEQNGM
jgi:hypothetical protein